jgi:hypothetical protein
MIAAVDLDELPATEPPVPGLRRPSGPLRPRHPQARARIHVRSVSTEIVTSWSATNFSKANVGPTSA